MTRKDATQYLEWGLKVAITALLGIGSYVLSNAANELKDLQLEVRTMRIEYVQKISDLSIEIAILKAKMDSHIKVQ